MDSNALADLIRTSTKEDFTARFASLFLMISARFAELEDEAGFNTMVEDVPSGGKRKSSAQRRLDIVEIAKAKGNPYPDRISVGRARNCDVVLRDPSVSKLHAHFRIKGTAYELVDLKSQNGTCVNGKPLGADEPEAVSSGDVLLFGSVSARLVNAALLYDLLR
jgi:hypothetical protein